MATLVGVAEGTASDTTFGFTATLGNVLVLTLMSRNSAPSADRTPPTGYVQLAYNRTTNPVGFQDAVVVFGKVSDGTESSWTALTGTWPTTSGRYWFLSEWSGITLAGASTANKIGSGFTMTCSALTAGDDGVALGIFVQSQDNFKTFTPVVGTLVQEHSSGSHPAGIIVSETASSGVEYIPEVDSNRNNGWRSIHLILLDTVTPPDPPDPPVEEDPVPGFWFPELAESVAADSTQGELQMLYPQGAEDGGGDDELANFTDRVIRATIRQPGDQDHTGGSFQSGATIIVKNADGRFNTDNVASPYYGFLRPGREVWIGCLDDGAFEGDGTVIGLFGGYIEEIVPVPVAGVSTGTPTAEIICRDVLDDYKQAKARITFSTDRTIADLRQDALLSGGEIESRLDLANESQTLAWSGEAAVRGTPIVRGGTGTGSGSFAASQFSRPRPVYPNLLALLEELNHATGTRHYIQPGESKEQLYYYKTLLRQAHVSEDAVDAWSGDDIVDASSYRTTRQGIVNSQEAKVSSALIDPTPVVVWEANTPIAVDNLTPAKEMRVDYGDFVLDAEMTQVSDPSVDISFTDYGNGALIAIGGSGPGTVYTLRISGRRLNRGSPETVEKRSTVSISTYRERAGSPIESEYLQARGEAEGICAFVIWKFAQPLKKPTVSFINDLTTTLPRGLYDVVTMSINALDVSAKRFEITDRTVSIFRSTASGLRHFEFTFGLQETPNQTALNIFTLDESLLGGSDVLAV